MASTIHELLELLRSQHAAMLGRKSAETLSAFLSGFAFERSDAGDAGAGEFLLAFNDWVRGHFHIESTQGWAKIIAFYSNNESDELDLFWRLYDQYMARRHQNGRRAKVDGHSAKARKTG